MLPYAIIGTLLESSNPKNYTNQNFLKIMLYVNLRKKIGKKILLGRLTKIIVIILLKIRLIFVVNCASYKGIFL